MYDVSEQFISAIKNNARYISAYFTFEGKKYYPRKVMIEDDIYTNDAFVGTFIAKNGTLTINVKDNLNLEDKEISLFMGVKTGESFEYIIIGTFKIYERISENEYKIMDYRYKFNVKFDIAQVVFPTNPLKLLKAACEQSGVELNTVDFPNKALEIPFEIFFGYEATCADVVTAVAQSSCCFAKVNRANKLELKWFDQVDFNIDYDHQKDRNEIDLTHAINTVVLAREPQNDNVYYPEVVDNDRVEFKIVNNPILDIDRYVSIVPIYNRMKEFNYLPFSMKTQGYFHIDAGDIIKRQRSDMSYENLLIMNHRIDFSGGVSSSFETPALTKTKIDYSIASVIENKILNTELQVDKVKGEINAIAKETSGLNEKFAEFVIDVNGIKQEVKETTEKVESFETQTADLYYYLSTSSTSLVGGSWSTTAPSWVQGKYIWQKTKYTFANGTTKESNPVCVTGNDGQDGTDGGNGKDGVGIKSSTITYQASTSGTAVPTGVWSSTIPSVSANQYLWTRTILTLSNSTSSTSYTIGKIGGNGLNGADGADGTDGKNGADGKGIKSTIVTYQASSSGTVTPTGTWSVTVPTVADNQYLWTRTTFTYTDNTSIQSYSIGKIGAQGPKGDKGDTGAQGLQGLQGKDGGQGIQGTAGANGQTSYFHIKYAPVQAPTSAQMTETPNTFIGTYVDYTLSDSTDPSKYMWSRFQGSQGTQGTQGIPGTNGSNGQTSYLHIKYSDDGGKTFTTNSGEDAGTYIGTCTDFVANDPTVVSAYKWAKIKGEIGPQGFIGPKGVDGAQLYTWLKYADSPTTGMSDSPANKNYIGLAYNKSTATESNVYGDYSWSLVKGPQGQQGIQGANGANGQPTYTWVKYATSASGASLSDDPTGKTYIGLAYNKTTATESTVATDYTWSLIKGDKGDTGNGVTSIITEHYLSTSKTTQTGGSWSTTVPIWIVGKYMWTRSKITYTNGTTSYTTPICDSSWEVANDVDKRLTTEIKTVTDKQAIFETKVASIEGRVSSTESQITTVKTDLGVVKSTAEKTKTDLSALTLDLNGFKTTVSSTYSSKQDLVNAKTEVLSTSATDAQKKADKAKTDAITSANANTTTALKSYMTTDQTNTAIKQANDSIKLSVEQTTNLLLNFDSNMFNDCIKSIEKTTTDTAVKKLQDMPIGIDITTLRNRDICISVDVVASNVTMKSLGNYAGALFTVTYSDNTTKTYKAVFVPGVIYLQNTLAGLTKSINQRLYATYRIDDKVIKSVSALALEINLNGNIVVANPKVEFGVAPSGIEFSQKEQELRLQNTELLLTPTEITALVNERIGGDGELKTMKFVLNKDGGEFYDGGLSIFNKSNEKVLYADTDGNLTIKNLTAVDGNFSGVVNATGGSFTGTVYANEGSFNGTVTSNSGNIGGWNVNDSGFTNGVVKIDKAGVTNIYTWADIYIIRLIIEGIIVADSDMISHYDFNDDGKISSTDYVLLKNRLKAL